MKIDDLLILTYDQIDYSSLPVDALEQLALSDELFTATSALTELSIRNSPSAASVAWEILSKALGDHFLQARALEVLFKMNRKKTLDFMRQQVPEYAPFMLNRIMEFIMENARDFESEPGLSIAHLVIKRLKELDEEATSPKLEAQKNFLKLFKPEFTASAHRLAA